MRVFRLLLVALSIVAQAIAQKTVQVITEPGIYELGALYKGPTLWLWWKSSQVILNTTRKSFTKPK